MTTQAIVALAFGAWGAGLSTYRQIRDWRVSRPRLDLKLNVLIRVRGKEQEKIIVGDISNPGRLTVTVNSFGLQMPNKRLISPARPLPDLAALPYELSPEQACRVGMLAATIARLLKQEGYTKTVRLVPRCCDQVGRVYYGGTYRYWLDTGLILPIPSRREKLAASLGGRFRRRKNQVRSV